MDMVKNLFACGKQEFYRIPAARMLADVNSE